MLLDSFTKNGHKEFIRILNDILKDIKGTKLCHSNFSGDINDTMHHKPLHSNQTISSR